MSKQKKLGLILIAISLGVILLAFSLTKENKKIVESHTVTEEEWVEGDLKDFSYITEHELKYKADIDKYNLANEHVYEFIEFINAKEFEKAYNMIDTHYRETFSLDLNFFQILYDFDKEKMFYAEKMSQKKGNILLDVKILDYNAPDEPDENMKYTSKTFTIIPQEDGSYTLADIGLIRIWNTNIETEEQGLRVAITKKALTTDGYLIVANLTNNTNETITLSSEPHGITVKEKDELYRHSLIRGTPSDYTLLPKGEKEYKIFFKHSQNPEIFKIEFTNQIINKTIIEEKVAEEELIETNNDQPINHKTIEIKIK